MSRLREKLISSLSQDSEAEIDIHHGETSRDSLIPRTFRDNLSLRIWGLDWNEFFPIQINERTTVTTASFEQIGAFYEKHYATLFSSGESESRFQKDETTRAKARYYRELGDFFAILSGQETIGVMACVPSDWSSYMIRTVALLPAHQGSGLYQSLIQLLSSVLEKHGVERIEGDVSPANAAHIHALNKMGFVATGMSLSERWGGLIHFTRYLAQDKQRSFEESFCASVRPMKAHGVS